jgi:predicted membrane protein
MFTPKFTSAMSGFGYIYTFYLIIVALELWFVFRPDVIRLARECSGLKKAFYSVLALGAFDVSEKTLHLDHKITTVLAAIGIPSACVLHGYVGFLFGSLKSNPWWSTPLMPIIFLMSAIVSGIAILIVSYAVVMKLKGKTVDNNCMQSLCSYLWGFFIIDVTLELLELLTMAYEGEESWGILSQLIGGKLQLSYVALQFIVCSTIPLVLLGIVSLMKLKESTRNTLGIISAALLLIQVLAMRWNVVIGGQLFSKSLLGFTSYFPSLLGREGLLVALILFAMPFVCMYIANIIVPYWKEE